MSGGHSTVFCVKNMNQRLQFSFWMGIFVVGGEELAIFFDNFCKISQFF